MKKFSLFLLVAMVGVAACDLQPKIVALPDTVGEFITARYPALLADPTSQPEIYNSAATDYGVYASPELYGSSSGADDYVLYASVDDYIVPPQPDEEPESADTETDVKEYQSDDVLVIPEQQQSEPEDNDEDDDIAWDENAKTDDTLSISNYENGEYITVARGDTLYVLGKKYGVSVDELAKMNNMSEPYRLSVGQKLRIHAAPEVKAEPKKPEIKSDKKPAVKSEPAKSEKPATETSHKTTTRVALGEITVAPGDTLYSLSRKHSVPVNDLAVMNNLSAPFGLYAGQKLKVPDLSSAPVRSATTKPVATPKADVKSTKQSVKQPDKVGQKTPAKSEQGKQQAKQPATKKQDKKTDKTTQKQPQKQEKTKQQTQKPKAKTSQSTNKMPAITARSSSKFSWPVRGKILSNYGAKTNGLFNDGINIGAAVGTAVVAAENGVVAYAGNEVKGMGNLIIIQHSDGWMTVYAHMDSISLRRGARVNVGNKIGTVGKTGKVDKPQLHFEIRKGTKAYNPLQYLKK